MKSLCCSLLFMSGILSAPLCAATTNTVEASAMRLEEALKSASPHMKTTEHLILYRNQAESILDKDMIVAYDEFGNLEWDVKLNIQIVDWFLKKSNQTGRDLLYILGKPKTYQSNQRMLICIDPFARDNRVLWQQLH